MAGPNQKPDSMNEVITSVTHMLDKFEDFVRAEMTDTNVIYDQQLSYETGLQAFIEKTNFDSTEEKPDPLLIYNRTVTEDSLLGFASRARNTTGKLRLEDSILKYSCAYSEYDLNFLYVTHDIRKKEAFEVAYNSNSGLSACRELVVDMGDLGEFKYFLTALPLTEITINNSGVTYKAIGGIMRVRGFFFVFEGSSGLIKEINLKIYDAKDKTEKAEEKILADIQILGEE